MINKPPYPPSTGTKENTTLWSFVRNVMSLTSIQFVSYLVPMVTLPYLTRVLGVEAWGQLAFYQAFSMLFILVVNWGFPVYATSAAAMVRGNKSELSYYLSNILLAQFLLFGLVTLAAIGLAVWPNSVAGDKWYLAAIWLMTLSIVIFPSWMYQAMEQFRFLAISKIVARVLPVPLIFLLVRSPEEAQRVIFLNAGAAVLMGIFALWWLWRRFGISVLNFRLGSALHLLHRSALMFVSSLAGSTYTSLVPIVLGSLVNPSELALFALADRVRQLVANIFLPISQSLLPRMSFLMKQDQADGVRFLKIVGLPTIIIMMAISFGIVWAAPQILTLLGGAEFVEGAAALRIMAFVPAVVAVSNIIGIQYLVPSGRQRTVNTVLISVALVALFAMYPMIRWNGAEGAAMLVLGSETLISLILIWIILKTH